MLFFVSRIEYRDDTVEMAGQFTDKDEVPAERGPSTDWQVVAPGIIKCSRSPSLGAITPKVVTLGIRSPSYYPHDALASHSDSRLMKTIGTKGVEKVTGSYGSTTLEVVRLQWVTAVVI